MLTLSGSQFPSLFSVSQLQPHCTVVSRQHHVFVTNPCASESVLNISFVLKTRLIKSDCAISASRDSRAISVSTKQCFRPSSSWKMDWAVAPVSFKAKNPSYTGSWQEHAPLDFVEAQRRYETVSRALVVGLRLLFLQRCSLLWSSRYVDVACHGHEEEDLISTTTYFHSDNGNDLFQQISIIINSISNSTTSATGQLSSPICLEK
jgi:hypothetical protein